MKFLQAILALRGEISDRRQGVSSFLLCSFISQRLPGGAAGKWTGVYIRELPFVAAIRIHYPKFIPPASSGAEQYLLSVGRPRGIITVAVGRIFCESGALGAIRIDDPDLPVMGLDSRPERDSIIHRRPGRSIRIVRGFQYRICSIRLATNIDPALRGQNPFVGSIGVHDSNLRLRVRGGTGVPDENEDLLRSIR